MLAPDLASLGNDRTPLAEVSLASWRDQIVQLVSEQAEHVILVGHSRGGVVISEVAEKIPTRIESLVYLTAFLCRNGESLFSIAQTDADAIIGKYFLPSEDETSLSLLDEGIEPTLYADCDKRDVARAKSLLRPEPMVVLTAPVRVTNSNFGSVPRAYVFCSNDHAIGLATQRRMEAALKCERTTMLDSSHSPFFSMPEKLVEAIVQVSNR